MSEDVLLKYMKLAFVLQVLHAGIPLYYNFYTQVYLCTTSFTRRYTFVLQVLHAGIPLYYKFYMQVYLCTTSFTCRYTFVLQVLHAGIPDVKFQQTL